MKLTTRIIILSFGQTHKTKRHTCGLPISYSEEKNLQKKWNETIVKLKKELTSINTTNKRFEIKKIRCK